MSFTDYTDYTEEDQQLHDFVITHNRKLKDIKTIVNNIMWSLCALTDTFEGFQFITADENNLANIVRSYSFSSHCNDIINKLIYLLRDQLRSAHKYSTLQSIALKYDLLPSDILNVAKTNFAELYNRQ